MFLKPISWKQLHQDASQIQVDAAARTQSAQSRPVARSIRAGLEGAPILRDVGLAEFRVEMQRISAEAMKLRDSSASFWGLLIIVFALGDLFGNAFGRPTASVLLTRILLQHDAGDPRAVLLIWLIQAMIYGVGFSLLRASPWRFWIRRALIRALPAYLGGDEAIDATRTSMNLATILCFGIGSLIACALIPGSDAFAMVGAFFLGLLIFLVAKAILPVMIVDDRMSIWAALAGGVLSCMVAFVAGSDIASLSPLAELTNETLGFQANQYILGCFGIAGIAGVLLGSWHQRVVFNVQMNPQQEHEKPLRVPAPDCVQVNSLLGLPAPTTYVSFDGSDAYLVLIRKPVDDTYIITKPLERIFLNAVEVSIINLASVSELEVNYQTTNGATTTVVIRVGWPQATSLAKSFKGRRISQEVVEWFEGMVLRNGGFLKRLEERIPGLIELPRARLHDSLTELALQYDRLTTNLERKRVVPHILTQDLRINRLLTSTEGFVRFWEGLDEARNRVDQIRSDFTREKIVQRWQNEFSNELETELFRSFETALSAEHRGEAETLLRPVADAVSQSISANFSLDQEIGNLLKRPETLEQQFQVINRQLSDEITACLAEQENTAQRRDDEALSHRRDP